LALSICLAADSDAETDEDEGHIEDAEKAQQRDREKHDESEELSNKDIQDSDEDVPIKKSNQNGLILVTWSRTQNLEKKNGFNCCQGNKLQRQLTLDTLSA